MHLLIFLLGALLLIPAALAGIAAGLHDLMSVSGELAAQIGPLIEIGRSLWPACCALAAVAGGLTLLVAGFVLLARGLQSGG